MHLLVPTSPGTVFSSAMHLIQQTDQLLLIIKGLSE